MDTAKLLVGECLIAFSINSFQAIKQGVVPFPGVLARTCIAYGILGCVAYVDADLAGLLGAGFLLALIIMQAQSGWDKFGALTPTDGNYFYLTVGGTPAAATDGPAIPAGG